MQLIPHIKSAHQIRSYVKMTIKRRTKALTSFNALVFKLPQLLRHLCLGLIQVLKIQARLGRAFLNFQAKNL